MIPVAILRKLHPFEKRTELSWESIRQFENWDKFVGLGWSEVTQEWNIVQTYRNYLR
jgi:hypothetical protein